MFLMIDLTQILNSLSPNIAEMQYELTVFPLILLAILGSIVVNGSRFIVDRMSLLQIDGFYLKSLARWNSKCSNCGRFLIIRDWIPILEYLIASKACKNCTLKLTRIELQLDLGVALCSILIPLVFGWSVIAFSLIWIIWICVLISLVDIRFQIIPEFACWLLLFSGLLWSPFEPEPMLRIAGAAIASFVMWVSLTCVGLIKDEDTHAGGDVALASASGAWIGTVNLPLFLIISSMLFAVHGFARLKLLNQLWTPMAPAISVGLVVTLLISMN